MTTYILQYYLLDRNNHYKRFSKAYYDIKDYRKAFVKVSTQKRFFEVLQDREVHRMDNVLLSTTTIAIADDMEQLCYLIDLINGVLD